MTEKEYHNKLKELIGQAIGRASMCWSNIPTSVFDSENALKVADDLFKDVTRVVDRRWREMNKRENDLK